jgi:putative spermidine/putrescine transport system permease protein
MLPERVDRVLLLTPVVLLYVFLIAPVVVVLLSAFNAGNYLTFPPQGLSLRWFEHFLESPTLMNSLFLSLQLALIVAAVSTVLGTAAALYVVRWSGRYREFLRILLISPLALPGILTAIAILILLYAIGVGTRGMIGLVGGHIIVTLPFVFLIVSAVLVRFDRSLEEAARNLGAGPYMTFWRVTLPLIRSGIVAGAIFAFISSYDNVPMSLLLASVGMTPLPIQLFDYLRFAFDPTPAAAGTLSIALAVAVVVISERLVGLDTVYVGRSKR